MSPLGRYNLGRWQVAILRALAEDSMDRATLYDIIRTSLYNGDVSKSTTRHRIRQAIKTLKQRNLINEQQGILCLTDY